MAVGDVRLDGDDGLRNHRNSLEVKVGESELPGMRAGPGTVETVAGEDGEAAGGQPVEVRLDVDGRADACEHGLDFPAGLVLELLAQVVGAGSRN